MTNKRKANIRKVAAELGINRRAAATRLDAGKPPSIAQATKTSTSAIAATAAYAGPRGDAAPGVPLRELWACAAAGLLTCDGDSCGWAPIEPPPSGAPAELVERSRSAPYVQAMEQNNWATEARYALRQIGRDVATAYAESVRSGAPALCLSTAPTPVAIPEPGESVLAVDVFRTDPGWRSIGFTMSWPVSFQYRIEAGDRGFTAMAKGRRREGDGRTSHVTLSLRGRIDDAGELWTSAIDELWTSTPQPDAAGSGARS